MTPSPLPWKVSIDYDAILDAKEHILVIRDNDRWDATKTDMELIVKAVNLHAQLVAALEEVKEFIADGSYHNWTRLEYIETLLALAKKGDAK